MTLSITLGSFTLVCPCPWLHRRWFWTEKQRVINLSKAHLTQRLMPKCEWQQQKIDTQASTSLYNLSIKYFINYFFLNWSIKMCFTCSRTLFFKIIFGIDNNLGNLSVIDQAVSYVTLIQMFFSQCTHIFTTFYQIKGKEERVYNSGRWPNNKKDSCNTIIFL